MIPTEIMSFSVAVHSCLICFSFGFVNYSDRSITPMYIAFNKHFVNFWRNISAALGRINPILFYQKIFI